MLDTPRLPIGNLFVSPAAAGDAIGRVEYRANLFDANITGAGFGINGTRLFGFTLLVHATEQVVILTVDPPGAARINYIADPAVPPVCSRDPFVAGAEQTGNLGPEVATAAPPPPCPLSSRTPGKTYQFNPPARCTNTSCEQRLLGGGDFAVRWGLHASSPGTFLLTVANSISNYVQQPAGALTTATATIAKVAAADLGSIVAAHQAWWHQYWPMHHVSIPDTVIEQYYIIQFYKLASATRCDSPENCFAYDLNGPWLEVNEIWADYHYDLNASILVAFCEAGGSDAGKHPEVDGNCEGD